MILGDDDKIVTTSEIDLLQLKLIVALDLVERLDIFLLNPNLTLKAVGQG